ncbi:MAG: glutaconyl-CoA decarboxylase subunit alpha, partial [Desulfobacteraceae bacterium]
MKSYFRKMNPFGSNLPDKANKETHENVQNIFDVEKEIADAVETAKNAGFSTEKINARGQMTLWQRLEYLVDEDTWCPLHTLYNPEDNV